MLVFQYFEKILIHEYVYNKELDKNSKLYIDEKIKINKAEILTTPKQNIQYDSYLNELENHELMRSFSRRKNAGEIHSIAYAKLYNIPYFSTNDGDATVACKEIKTFNSVKVIGLEKLLIIAEKTLDEDVAKNTRKIRRSMFKRRCRKNTTADTYNKYCSTFL